MPFSLKRTAFCVIAGFVCVLSLAAVTTAGQGVTDPFYRTGALFAPEQVYPVSCKVVLSGLSGIEFRWRNDARPLYRFEFRLYEGYKTYAAALLYKDRNIGNVSSLTVKRGIFPGPGVYTWSLVRVLIDGRKSEKAFASFEVVE